NIYSGKLPPGGGRSAPRPTGAQRALHGAKRGLPGALQAYTKLPADAVKRRYEEVSAGRHLSAEAAHLRPETPQYRLQGLGQQRGEVSPRRERARVPRPRPARERKAVQLFTQPEAAQLAEPAAREPV